MTDDEYQKALRQADKHRLADLKAERKRLIAQYGSKGEKHPSGRLIGGLNPAAMRLHGIRQEIAFLEKDRSGKETPKIRPLPGSSKGYGLKSHFSYKGFEAMLGTDNFGVWYAVHDGNVIMLDEHTPSKAVKRLVKFVDLNSK